MAQKANPVHVISAGGVPTYDIFEHDENFIKIQLIASEEHHLLVDKQALRSFAEVFAKLASQFTA